MIKVNFFIALYLPLNWTEKQFVKNWFHLNWYLSKRRHNRTEIRIRLSYFIDFSKIAKNFPKKTEKFFNPIGCAISNNSMTDLRPDCYHQSFLSIFWWNCYVHKRFYFLFPWILIKKENLVVWRASIINIIFF